MALINKDEVLDILYKDLPVDVDNNDPILCELIKIANTIEKLSEVKAIPIDWADEKVDKYFSETVKCGWEELKHLWEGYGPEGYAIWQRVKERENATDRCG